MKIRYEGRSGSGAPYHLGSLRLISSKAWRRTLGAFACLFVTLRICPAFAVQPAGPQYEELAPAPSVMTPPVASGGQPKAAAASYGLDELSRLMEQHNPTLSRDLARIEEARGTALQAGIWPNIRLDPLNPAQFAGSNSQYSLGLMQNVVTAGKLRLDQSAALEALRQAQLTYELDRHTLLRNVRLRFFTVLSAQERTKGLQTTRQIVDQAEQTGQRLFQGGQGTRTDVLALAIEARRVGVALQNALTLQVTGKQQLAAAVGLPDLEINRLAGNLYFTPPQFDAETVRDQILARNVQIQIAQVEISRRQFLLRRAEVEPIPNPDAAVGYQYAADTPHSQVLVYVATPIPLWNRNQGGIASAAANVRESVESVGVVQNSLLQQAADALGRYNAAVEQAEEIRIQILPKAMQAADLARSGYQKGEFDFPRFLTAQRNLVDAQIGYVEALGSLWTAGVDLAQLLQLETFP
jgi:cobalt-zinc-cadmium efflux system outer membrane protein